uniref:Peptidase S8/S53 domain-containing protein n=1 Tax=Panagrolaimus davidi TaxID=227884 RepID=A0A914PXW6_9BILA
MITKSATNFGPFISSLKNFTTHIDQEIFTVGSINTSDTNSIFGEKIDDPPIVTFYSSRGPLPNGARGVTFGVPSSAVIENPGWYTSKKKIFEGTSCASPIAAGAIACLLSALKANSMKYTPATIKMVLCNTAFLPKNEDRLSFGNGIIQINSAFEYYLKNNKNYLSKIIVPQISVKNESNEKGIIIYKIQNDQNIYDFCINIENSNIKIPWILKSFPKENEKYIKYSKTVENNLFNIKIDTKELKQGYQYYSEIHGFDPSNISVGPIFHIPITVIIPENLIKNSIKKEIFMKSTSIFRLILNPESISQKCIVKITSEENGKIECEKVFEKADIQKNCRDEKVTNGAGFLRSFYVNIQWERMFEICIYQLTRINDNSVLKCFLEILFEN